jgi:hypothetical protein
MKKDNEIEFLSVWATIKRENNASKIGAVFALENIGGRKFFVRKFLAECEKCGWKGNVKKLVVMESKKGNTFNCPNCNEICTKFLDRDNKKVIIGELEEEQPCYIG